MDYENNLLEWLSETHREFLTRWIDEAQQREAAVIERFLAAKER